MRRYPLVIAGTVVGAAAVIGFPVHRSTLVLHSAAASGGSGGATGVGSTTSTTAPANPSGGGTASTTPGTSPTTAAPSSATRSATGADEQFRYGDVAVAVTVRGTKVTGVRIAALNEPDGRSASIDSFAVPQLEQQVIAAGSANISGVSGATFTSQAFYDSLTSALQKLGIS